ncbi:MAG: hypothetical protein ACKOS8_07630 [Gemmataceae bacterium]
MMLPWLLGMAAVNLIPLTDKPVAKPDPPRLTMVWPWVVEADSKTECLLRGGALGPTTRVSLVPTPSGKHNPDPLQVLEKPKDFALPDGMDAKANGNQVMRVELGSDTSPGDAILRVEGDNNTQSELPLEITKTKLIRDAEPNNDLETAQTAGPLPARILGTIPKPQDCDCFRLELTQGQKLRVQVITRRKGSLLDPILTIQQPDGSLWKTAGPPPKAEDLVVITTAHQTGPVCLVVRDAFDSGSPMHGYELRLELVE